MTIRKTTPALAAAFAGLALSGGNATVSAQETGAGAFAGIEEVVVTARRREEDLQAVPAAVSAFSAGQLRDLAITNLEDVTALVPNIKVNPGRATSNTINAYIRGVGQNDPLWGFEPGVGIYLDDVYIARPQGALLDLYDVDRVEILRGPQGTLYGKNTLAGAIKYMTRDIVGDPYLSASIAAGSYSQLDAKLSGSTNIGEHVYIGAALAQFTRDGYGEVVDSGSPNLFNSIGEDVSDKDIFSARAEVNFLWGESSRLRITGDYLDDNSNARGGQRLNEAFGGALDDRYDVRNDTPVGDEHYEFKGYSATYTVDINDQWGLKAIGAHREGDGVTFLDFDTLNVVTVGAAQVQNLFNVPAQYSDEQTTGELQLTYTGDRFKAVGGLYYFDGWARGAFNAVTGAFNLVALTKGQVDTQSYAVYFDSTFALTDQLNLNVGARYNEDKKDATVYAARFIGQIPSNVGVFDQTNLPPTLVPFDVQSNYSNSRTDDKITPKLGLDFHFNDDVMVYAQYSDGFKSGGFDMRGNQAVFPDTVNGYKPETVTNYEVGLKSLNFDNTLRLNLTVFYAEYEDVQITTQQFVTVMGAPTNATAVLNAGRQVNQGVELESVWQPNSAFTFSTAVGYLDAEVKEFYASNPLNPGEIVNYASVTPVINAPEWTFAADAQYRFALFGGEASARLGYQWRDDTSIAPLPLTAGSLAGESVTDQPAYDIVDASLAWVTAGGNWRFSVDGKNLTDEWYRNSGYDFGTTGATANYSQIGYYGPPRTYTFTVRYQY